MKERQNFKYITLTVTLFWMTENYYFFETTSYSIRFFARSSEYYFVRINSICESKHRAEVALELRNSFDSSQNLGVRSFLINLALLCDLVFLSVSKISPSWRLGLRSFFFLKCQWDILEFSHHWYRFWWRWQWHISGVFYAEELDWGIEAQSQVANHCPAASGKRPSCLCGAQWGWSEWSQERCWHAASSHAYWRVFCHDSTVSKAHLQ